MRLNHAAVKGSAGPRRFLFAVAWCFILASVLLFAHGSAHAAQATARWTSQADAAGYKLYYGLQSGSHTTMIDVGNSTSRVVSNLAAGTTYYFALTAYNSSGVQSGYSADIAYTTPCSYSISPASSSVGASGGTGSVAVTTQSGCAWSVTNGASWLAITSGSTGTGSGSVAYSVAANTSTASRSAAITIANNTFSCTQSGATGSTSYTITTSAGSGGTISPQSATVSSGASASFTITPASGYGIGNVTVDGASVGAVSTYTFTNVTRNHTIAASFAEATSSATSLSTLSLNPSSVRGGVKSTGTVRLSAAAPSGGAVVALKSSVWCGVVPASVKVAAGATSATFTITTSRPYYNTSVVITASYNGKSLSKTLYVTR